MNKPRICFISGVISRSGGTERVGTIIANALNNVGYNITILSFWNQGSPFFVLNDNIEVKYLLNTKIEGKLYRTKIYPIIKLHRFIIKNKIDIVIDIDTVLSYYTALSIKGTGCRLISWEHFNYWAMLKLNENKRFTAKKLIKKNASKLVVLTEEDREKHIEMYNLDSNFVVTIPNPIVNNNSKSEYNFNHKVFLAVGRLAPEKNFGALLKAWALIQDKCVDWRLVIVGKGELESELKHQASYLKLKNLSFAGHTSHIEDFYKNASCYVLSSNYEGFPMVILEAQSFGLPVISFDCKTGPRDLIHDNHNGYLIENGNIELLSERMLQFSLNRDKAIEMSKTTLKDVQKYNLSDIVKKWTRLLNDVINPNK